MPSTRFQAGRVDAEALLPFGLLVVVCMAGAGIYENWGSIWGERAKLIKEEKQDAPRVAKNLEAANVTANIQRMAEACENGYSNFSLACETKRWSGRTFPTRVPGVPIEIPMELPLKDNRSVTIYKPIVCTNYTIAVPETHEALARVCMNQALFYVAKLYNKKAYPAAPLTPAQAGTLYDTLLNASKQPSLNFDWSKEVNGYGMGTFAILGAAALAGAPE